MVNLSQKYMNKRVILSMTGCATFLGFACTNIEEGMPIETSECVEITITAVRECFDPGTRTVRESDGSVEWCPMDEISVFYDNGVNGGSKFTSQNTEQSAIAEFRGRLDGISAGGNDFTDGKYLYGVYPYSVNNQFNDGVVTISLPTHQTAAEGTFANGLFPTIARAQGVNLAFYNICGGVKFTVSRNDITSVIFKGNNNERLAGTAKIAFDSNEIPVVLEDEIESKDEIVVYAPAGGTFEVGKDYYIVAYPTKLSSGFTMTFRTSDMKEGVYVHDNEVEIMRSYFGVLNNVDENVDSWTDLTYAGGGNDSGIYLGVMGFNQQLYSYPISKLSTETKAGFDSFIDDLAMKNGTLLYYSVDQTINTMQSVQLPQDLKTAAIVTFTDGLDQGSIMMNVSYQDNTEYLNAVNNRLTSETISGLPITAYSIGIRGQDVADVTTFQNNLKKLASSPENATEVTSMAEVNAKFKEIAEQLSQNNYIQTINLKMPGVSNGTVVRFTFDNINSATKSKLYIEGTFNLAERSLENIKYMGLSSSSGSYVKGVVDGIFVTFTFENVHADNNILIDNQFTDEWIYVPSSNIWQINSEFDKNENSDIVNVRSSAAIMLVLDCSSSLADDFVKAQSNAKDFVNTLYDALSAENNSGSSGDNSTPGEDNPSGQFPAAIDLSSSETSNCYVLSTSGVYKFKTVKGNSNTSVGSVARAEVLWESFGTDVVPSVGDLIKSVSYEDGYIAFQTADTFKEGNAVIAAKDVSGKILWSWHIWLTDEPGGQVYYNGAGTMMDRNLGATSATPGDVGALGLLYQWGRKDPFLGSSSISSSTIAESTITWPSAVSSNSSNGTIAYATANPTTFITYNESNLDWYYTGSSSTDNTRWTESSVAKSIYDPCPSGWRVPDGGENGVWSNASLFSISAFSYSYDNINKGMNFSLQFGKATTIWYPAAGDRSDTDGSLGSVGLYGCNWSASPDGNDANYYVYVSYLDCNGFVSPVSYLNCAIGLSVRCIHE